MATAPTDTRSLPRRALEAFFGAIGEPIVFTASEIRGIARVAALTLLYTFRGPVRWKEVWVQSYRIGNRSLVFIAAVSGSLGMTLVYQSGIQAQRIVGDLTLIGALFLQLLLREFGPTITAMMVATRVGTGIAAEIGSMVVTEQVDALRMSGAQPVKYLIVPRFIATTVMVFALTIFSILVSYIAGLITAMVAFDVSPYTYVNFSMLIWGDLILGLSKALTYGMVIPIVAGHSGLAAHGGSEGVGWATTQSVVNCSLAVVFLDFILSGLGYAFILT